MMEGNLVDVRYVGTKALKRDTVCNTLTVWAGENDVASVPKEVAVKLFQYPTVWRPAEAPQIERPATGEESSQTDDSGSDSEKADQSGGEETGQAADSEQSTGEDGGEASDEKDESEKSDEQEPANTDPVTVEEVVQALPNLNKEEDFTQQGKPKLASLRAMFEGRELATQVAADAWETFEAAE
jgi:hypothetical protein